MKNSEQPAFGYGVPGDEKAGWIPTEVPGLTKREYFAGLAMQGLMSEVFRHDGHELTHAETIARISLRCADELLKQLEEQKS